MSLTFGTAESRSIKTALSERGPYYLDLADFSAGWPFASSPNPRTAGATARP
ncbi:MAG: hypothetical protein ACX933_08410 [Marinobacter adhaerens]